MSYRAKIKAFARDRLSSQYGTTLGAIFLAVLPAIIMGIINFIVVSIVTFITLASHYVNHEASSFLFALQTSLSQGFDVITYVLMPFTVVGLSAFMLSAIRGVREKFYFPYLHGAKNYGRKLGGILWQLLFTFLWSLLFVIPGIIKGLAYSFNHYILADCPNLSVRQALNLSKKMTKGIKGELFLFDLSFIGWWILTAFTCGLLAIYTVPYYLMAKASLYESMKNSALACGKITEADLDPTIVTYENNC